MEDSEVVLDAGIFKVYKGFVRFNDGAKPQYYIQRPSGVTVFGLDKDNNLIIISEYRSFLDKTILKAPGGGIEENEEPIEAAAREFEEETGYSAPHQNFIELTTFNMGGWLKWQTHFYLVKDAEPVENSEHLKDSSEQIKVVKIPLKEAFDFIVNSSHDIDPLLLYGIALVFKKMAA